MKKVTRENYRDYKYLSDYRDGKLEALSDEELYAQKFHLTDVYAGTKPPLSLIKKMAMRSINDEKKRRKRLALNNLE